MKDSIVEAYFFQMKKLFSNERWFINASSREQTKTNNQKQIDSQLLDAVYASDKTAALEALRIGATNDRIDKNGESPLYWACLFGCKDIADEILQKFPDELERKTTAKKGYWTPLAHAFQAGHLDIAEMLIDLGSEHPLLQWIMAAGLASSKSGSSAGWSGEINGLDLMHTKLSFKDTFKKL